MELLFQVVNLTVAPFWLLMIFLPHWRITRAIIGSPWMLAPLPLLYAILVVPKLPEVIPLLLTPTLTGIAALLGKPEAALIGWVHFLAFDLLVGRWIFLDSAKKGISAWFTAPILVLTFLLGPLGLLVYLLAFAWRSPRPAS